MSRRERPPYAWTSGIPLERRIPCGTSPLNHRRRIRRIFLFVAQDAADEVPYPIKKRVLRSRKASRVDVRGAGPWPTGVRKPPWNAAHQVPHPTKMRVLVRKASRADARGAGLWPTEIREPPENAAHQVPHPLKRGFSSARRPEAMRTGVREPLENAADEVPQLITCGLALQDRGARTSYAPRSSRKRAGYATSPC